MRDNRNKGLHGERERKPMLQKERKRERENKPKKRKKIGKKKKMKERVKTKWESLIQMMTLPHVTEIVLQLVLTTLKNKDLLGYRFLLLFRDQRSWLEIIKRGSADEGGTHVTNIASILKENFVK